MTAPPFALYFFAQAKCMKQTFFDKFPGKTIFCFRQYIKTNTFSQKNISPLKTTYLLVRHKELNEND